MASTCLRSRWFRGRTLALGRLLPAEYCCSHFSQASQRQVNSRVERLQKLLRPARFPRQSYWGVVSREQVFSFQKTFQNIHPKFYLSHLYFKIQLQYQKELGLLTVQVSLRQDSLFLGVLPPVDTILVCLFYFLF